LHVRKILDEKFGLPVSGIEFRFWGVKVEPVEAKWTCPPVPCGGDLSAFGGSRFIGVGPYAGVKIERHQQQANPALAGDNEFNYLTISEGLGHTTASSHKEFDFSFSDPLFLFVLSLSGAFQLFGKITKIRRFHEIIKSP
jgi:hypothetical protein